MVPVLLLPNWPSTFYDIRCITDDDSWINLLPAIPFLGLVDLPGLYVEPDRAAIPCSCRNHALWRLAGGCLPACLCPSLQEELPVVVCQRAEYRTC